MDRNTNKTGVYITYNTPAYVLENGGLTLFIELFTITLDGVVFEISAVFFEKGGVKCLLHLQKTNFVLYLTR